MAAGICTQGLDTGFVELGYAKVAFLGVVQGITEDSAGIGYSGIGYKTSGVKALQIAKKDGDAYHSVDAKTVLAGEYPLARPLVIYVNQKPGGLDPLTKEFLKFVLSKNGQQIVVKDGYVPLPAEIVAAELEKLK